MYKPGQRGRPPRRRPTPQQASKTTLSTGNCRVEFPSSLVFSLDADGLCINVSDIGCINIKVADETSTSLSSFSFLLLNPKNLDGPEKQLLQDVLMLYSQELPTMNFAANTGKESRFLETCILSGKYCTLVLRNADLELIGAMTYQILPTGAHQAELPLAAVAQAHHRKGFGAYLYKELQRRLLDVGVLSIFCWGDQESEAFWTKQGFVMVAEVDGRGKPWKLPIKADVRRAMSIPGSATLMISYLSSPSGTQPASLRPPAPAGQICLKTSMENSPSRLDSLPVNGEEAGNRLSPPLSVTTPQVVGESKSSQGHINTTEHPAVESASTRKNFCASITPLNMEGVLSRIPKVNVSKLPLSPRESPKITRSPLVNITNAASHGSTRPPKKRPFIKVGQACAVNKRCDPSPPSGATTSLDGRANAVPRNEDKDTQARPAIELKELSPSGRKGNAGVKLGEVQMATSEVNEEAQVEGTLDKKNGFTAASNRGKDYELKSAVDSEANVGVKRGRESEAQMKVFGRRSARRRKTDQVPDILTEAEMPEVQTDELTEKCMSGPDEDGLQLMINLLLPQQVKDTGGRITADAEKSMCDGLEPDNVMNRTTSITNLGDHSITHMGGEKSSRMETGCAAGSTEASQKLPIKTLNSSGAGQPSKRMKPVIMFMNMADENQKKQLTKYVERLKGEVISDGCHCTHVVTGEVRRTLNFCVAISSGAWILSPDWLKISVKQKSFADEARFILRDRKFEAKYKVSLQDVIDRARQRPNLLLNGMNIFSTPHVHPPVETISQIVKSAGGKTLGSLEEALQLEDKCHAAVIACEEDMSLAISAAKAGLLTFSSDWLLTCIVKQELDLTATQFSESL